MPPASSRRKSPLDDRAQERAGARDVVTGQGRLCIADLVGETPARTGGRDGFAEICEQLGWYLIAFGVLALALVVGLIWWAVAG
jgi:hypothetical protein